MIPSLAVVGHPNKGKSSIVATLAENTQVEIGPIPGTTRSANHYTLTIDGEGLYDLIDTPGFQRAGQVHNWLVTHASDASSRPELVRAFVDQHEGDPKFADECALLTPIINGAGVLYVVVGSKPYGAEYELEMEILQWTGQPRMALINMIGSGDHRDAWRAGLGQYFSIVREFNAHHASFSQRVALLRAFAELEESWRAPLERATEALTQERQRQLQQASVAIASLLQAAIAAKVQKRVPPEGQQKDFTMSLTARLQDQIRAAEAGAQQEVQRIYRHSATTVDSTQLQLLHADLFTEQSWRLFGLSRMQLVASGAVSGAVAGGAVDLLLGGASLLLGTVIGGALGSVTAWFGGPELAKIEVLGSSLGGDVATAGPIANPNFPWVLLGRACLHHTLVSERNHAVREHVVAQLQAGDHFFDFLEASLRNQVERQFSRIRKGDAGPLNPLQSAVADVLRAYTLNS